MKKWVVGISVALASGMAQGSQECADIGDNHSRLACYDAEYRPATSVSSDSVWTVRQDVSPIDDSTAVFMTVLSSERIPTRLGREDYATLSLRCQENTTSLILGFAGNHMTSHQQYGNVTLRLDGETAQTKRMNESTNRRSLGLWSGGSSIPYIRSMFGHDTLTVRATPYSESPITVQFPITGLEDAIQPLREACNW